MATVIELYYSGAWHAHSSGVLQRDAISITYGRPSPTDRVAASMLTLTINNDDNTYTSLIKRNMPIRVSNAGSYRFVGEIESKPQQADTDGHVWMTITAYGILRRLGGVGAAAPAESALARWYAQVTPQPAHLWPMEETDQATEAANAMGGPPLTYSIPSATKPGDGPSPAGAKPGTALVAGWDPESGEVGPMLEATGLDIGAAVTDLVVDHWFTADLSSVPEGAAGGQYVWALTDAPTVAVSLNLLYVPAITEEFAYVEVNGTFADDPLPIPNVFDGLTHHVRLVLAENGANTDVEVILDGASIGTTTVTGRNIPAATDLELPRSSTIWMDSVGAGLGMLPLAFSHFAIWTEADPPSPYVAGLGHAGETVAERLTRLCAEESIPLTITGAATAQLGPQRAVSVLESLHEAVDVDMGILAEARDVFGLDYRSRVSLYHQAAAITLDYAAEDLVPPLTPVEDTDTIANDVTVTRTAGGSARRVKTSGPLNVSEPVDDPDGVGRYPVQVELPLYETTDLPHQAGWRRHVGTIDVPRYAAITVDTAALTSDGKTTLVAEVNGANLGDRLVVDNPPAWIGGDSIDQIVQGWVETITADIDTGSTDRTVSFRTSPAAAYAVGKLDSPEFGVLGTLKLAL